MFYNLDMIPNVQSKTDVEVAVKKGWISSVASATFFFIYKLKDFSLASLLGTKKALILSDKLPQCSRLSTSYYQLYRHSKMPLSKKVCQNTSRFFSITGRQRLLLKVWCTFNSYGLKKKRDCLLNFAQLSSYRVVLYGLALSTSKHGNLIYK